MPDKITQIEILKFILSQVKRAEKRKAILDEQLLTLRDKLDHPIDGIEYKAVSGGGNPSEGASTLPIKIDEIERRIEAQKKEITSRICRVFDILEYLDVNSDERVILSAYYVSGETYEQIAEHLDIDTSTVWRKMGTGLRQLISIDRIQHLIKEAEAEWRKSL